MEAQNPADSTAQETMNPDGSPKSEAQLQYEADYQAMLEAAHSDGVAFCAGFIPKIRDEPQLLLLLEEVVRRQITAQPGLGRMVDDIIQEAPRASHPFIMVRILGPDPAAVQKRIADRAAGVVDAGPLASTQEIFRVMAPKGAPAGGQMDIRDVLNLAQIFGFLLYPPLRALLQAHGFEVVFHQARQTQKPSPIIQRP